MSKEKSKEKLVLECTYDGSNTNKNGITTMKFNFPATEIAKYLNVVMLLNSDIKLMIDSGESKGVVCIARFKNLRVNREGDAVLQLESMEVDFDILSNCFEKNIRLCLIKQLGE